MSSFAFMSRCTTEYVYEVAVARGGTCCMRGFGARTPHSTPPTTSATWRVLLRHLRNAAKAQLSKMLQVMKADRTSEETNRKVGALGAEAESGLSVARPSLAQDRVF